MMGDGVTFIHKDGRVIPIKKPNVSSLTAPLSAPTHALSVAAGPLKQYAKNKVVSLKSSAVTAHNAALTAKTHVDEGLAKLGLHTQPIKVNHGLDMLGLGISIGTGVIGAATFNTPKRFVTGLIATKVIDAGGVAANIGSVAGRGFRKERIQQGARQELRNFIIGNGVYAAGVLGIKSNRKAGMEAVKKLVGFGRRVLG